MKSWFPRVRRYRKGGRPVVPFQPVMVEIFYVLRSACQWKAAPNGFGSAARFTGDSSSGPSVV
ncbi:MAG: transposase [Planctomycetes bacterium]|nr:transposase [Planctomycetota bacterium]